MGRVVARFGPRFIVRSLTDTPADCDAVARGRRLDAVVGDRVRCSRERELLVIESVEARATLLFRSEGGRTKPLAANVDQVAIVFAPQPTPQREFLWRALLAARAAGVGAIALLNKVDLDCAAAGPMLDELATLGAQTLRVSARAAPEDTRTRLAALCAKRTTLFVGQSGMGKSTLLNLLVGAAARTGALSRHGTHGRQTTTATRWFEFEGGAVIDSPGFQAFGLAHIAPADLPHLMPDLAAVEAPCRFADCRHGEEPGCQVRAALERGQIDPERYAFYRRLSAA
jgi:ribosome biogenesis GTPase / thiamine phosphate phosphatase